MCIYIYTHTKESHADVEYVFVISVTERVDLVYRLRVSLSPRSPPASLLECSLAYLLLSRTLYPGVALRAEGNLVLTARGHSERILIRGHMERNMPLED